MRKKLSRKKWYDIMFEPNPWFYELQKEVRKKMAIDFREEWKKFRAECGRYYLVKDPGSNIEPTCTIGNVMDTWIRNVVLNRERLMEEYVKENIVTDICDGDKNFHHIKITNTRTKGQKSPIGTMYIHKADFDAWCKKKEKGGK